MGGQEQQLTGPDFRAGIQASQLKDGDKLLGHADGEAVLLTRIGEEFLAIGATCTHYSGPLAEGLIVGDTVRCPWHHACFSLRTGEALWAPALSPVSCWRVERQGDRVIVGEKTERDPLAPSYPIQKQGAAPESVVIIGAGAAGSAAAEMLRRCGFAGKITMVDQEPDSPYDRPNLSKDYLAGNAPEEWIPLRPSGFYAEHGIEVVRASARRLDVGARRVELDSGSSLTFDRCLVATGAEPIQLQIPGMDLKHVHTLRSLADSRGIVRAAEAAKQAVVIGASFIGLEAAASLRARNVEVTVVSPESLPLERVLGKELGASIQRLHESKGVVFKLGHKPAAIESDAVVLDDGTRLDAQLVVVGVGVKPRLDLAREAGLTLDQGVVVNEFLETSAAGVYAAGDIARWPDPHTGQSIRVEHWVVAQRMGQAAARNMLGARQKFAEVPFFWSAHYDMSVNYVGHAAKWDDTRVDGDPDARDVAVWYEQAGTGRALATIFRDDESLKEEVRMEQR